MMTDPSPWQNTPFHINFEQQKKRAKALLKQFREGNTEAITRFQQSHPHFNSLTPTTTKLSDAQWVIARELGLPSWSKLKAHAESMQQARQRIQNATIPKDADLSTLHIRCGSDIQSTLQTTGFSGDFLEYSDPICQGPVTNSSDLLIERANFLHDAYGKELSQSHQEIIAKLKRDQQKLDNAAKSYQRIVLWFEHDSYDQLILMRLLNHFAHHTPPAHLELVSTHTFPGSERFIGLGQLPPEAIWMLWQYRQAITTQQLSLGQQTWQALCSPDPSALAKLVKSQSSRVFPHLAGAITRHLQELPSLKNGLGLTEQLIFEIINDIGPCTGGQIFKLLMMERDPLPWLGDTMFAYILQNLLESDLPIISVKKTQDDAPWFKQQFMLTALGKQVLYGQKDWLSMEPPGRWLGGVYIQGGQPCWRWDELSQRVKKT